MDLDKALRDLNLSSQEASKLARAFEDPKLMQLLGDYAQSMADPKTKAEADEYLRQLEREGQLGEVLGSDTVLVVPAPAFVVKAPSAADGSKCFVNVCVSDKVKEASCKPVTDPISGRSGMQWDFPFVLGPLRPGADKQGAACHVYDATLHPATVAAAAAQQRVKDLLVDSILERIESQGGCKLRRKYSCPKLRYKKTEGVDRPPLVTLRTGTGAGGEAAPGPLLGGSSAAPSRQPAGARGGAASAAAPPPQHHPGIQVLSSTPAGLVVNSGSSGKAGGTRCSFKFSPAAAGSAAAAVRAAPVEQPAAAGEGAGTSAVSSQQGEAGGEREPKYEVVHRGEVDLGQTWGGAGRQLQLDSSRPKELVVRVELPGVESVSSIQLDASAARSLQLVVPGRYRLHVHLPLEVRGGDARAAFDKGRQRLEVTLPVVQPQQGPAPAPGQEEGQRQA